MVRGFTPPSAWHWERGEAITASPFVSRLEIKARYLDYDFRPAGELSRRVAEGEPIGFAGTFPLLSPVAGVVTFDPLSECYRINMQGTLKIGVDDGKQTEPLYRRILQSPRSRDFFLSVLQEGGLLSLEFPQHPLSVLIETVLAHPQPIVIFALADPFGSVNWKRIFASRKRELDQLVELFHVLFPKMGKVRHSGGAMLRKRGFLNLNHHPAVVARKYNGAYDWKRSPAEQGILFLGPRTLFALLELLFENKPLYSHPVSFVFPGKRRRKTLLLRLGNGFPLVSVLEELALQKNERVFQGLPFQSDEIDRESPGFFNLFHGNSFFIVSGADSREVQLCNGCGLCDRSCPVAASPLSLITRQKGRFLADRCFECGLCEAVCDRSIPLLSYRDGTGRG